MALGACVAPGSLLQGLYLLSICWQYRMSMSTTLIKKRYKVVYKIDKCEYIIPLFFGTGLLP